MRKLIFMLGMMMLVSGGVLVVASPSYAQEPPSLPPEPFVPPPSVPVLGTPDDNACHEGGSLEGKCESDWHWNCGYYLTRWESAGGHNGVYPMPAGCAGVLPPTPPPPPAPPEINVPFIVVAGCYGNSGSGIDYQYDGNVNTLNNGESFASTDGSCTTSTGNETFAQATSKADADTECTNLGLGVAANANDNDAEGWTGMVNLWTC